MIVTKAQADLRLNSRDNVLNRNREVPSEVPSDTQLEDDPLVENSSSIEIKELHSNRIGPQHSTLTQNLAVALATVDSQASVGKSLGMTQSNVSYLEREGKKIDRNLIKDTVQSVHSQALDAMLESINLLHPKLKDVKKARELSGIAADLSKVVNNTTPKEQAVTNIQIVAYAPRMRNESEYDEEVIVG